MTEQDQNIPIKSPLALTGVFLDVLRERFTAQQGLPWTYIPGDAGRYESTISIEAAGTPETEDYGKRPAIFVQRGPITFAQTSIRDSFDRNVMRDNELFYCIAQTSFTFSVEAEMPAEAEMIADVVLSTLLMGSDEIERAFQFRKLGPFAISAKAKTRQDVELTQVSVQMGLSYDVRWSSRRIAPILKEVIVRARDASYHSGDDYFIEIYQHSLADRPDSTISGEQ